MLIRDQVVKAALDWTAVGTAVGAITGFISPIAALFTIVWLSIQIWESATVQKLVARRRGKSDGAA